MTAGHSKDTISRVASCHGVIRSLRDLLYETDDGKLTFSEVCEQLNENPSHIKQGIQNQRQGDDPWLDGEPWVRLTTQPHPDADSFVDPDDEFSKVDVVEITESGREAAQKDVTEVDPGYQTGVGFGTRGKSV